MNLQGERAKTRTHAGETAQGVFDRAAHDELVKLREAAAAEMTRMVSALTRLVVNEADRRGLGDDDDATVTFDDSEHQFPDEREYDIDPDQPGEGATQLSISVSLGEWVGPRGEGENDFSQYAVGDVAIVDGEGPEYEPNLVIVRSTSELVSPLVDGEEPDSRSVDNTVERFGVATPAMREALDMTIPVPPLPEHDTAIRGLAATVAEQARVFDGETWPMLEAMQADAIAAEPAA